jgi:hypothetical protein
VEKSPKKLKFPKNLQGRALGRARVRGEGREGKSAQGRAPSPKKGSCALCTHNRFWYVAAIQVRMCWPQVPVI